MSFIEIKDVNVIYNEGSSNQVNALTNINLKIEESEYIIIFGPSGCGKSTLLNVIAGLERPTGGEVFIDKEDIGNMDADQLAKFHCTKIGMIFQAYNLLSSLSVRDNIVLPQVFLGQKNRKIRKRLTSELLEKFDILDQASKIPTQLSGGQQQRIGIARALINNQPIILADEPIGNLDSKSARNVMEILKELNEKEKKTIIMVTHDPENLDYAHRVFYMRDGKIEHAVVNKKHPTHKDTRREREIDLLSKAFPGFSQAQLHMLIAPFKAKALAEFLLTSTEMDQIQQFEELLRNRILGKLEKYEFRLMLDKPMEKRGAGLDSRTALRYADKIESILENAQTLEKDLRNIASKLGLKEIELKAKLFVRYLTRYFARNLNDRQKIRLERLFVRRLANEIGRDLFVEELDKSFGKGGVGVDKRVVKKITREMEITLLIKYGIRQ